MCQPANGIALSRTGRMLYEVSLAGAPLAGVAKKLPNKVQLMESREDQLPFDFAIVALLFNNLSVFLDDI